MDSGGGRRRGVHQSGAILLCLSDKTGRFLPAEPRKRSDTMQWLFWQVGGFGPMLGQAHHFNASAPMRPDGPVVLPYAQDRYTNEAGRLPTVCTRRGSFRIHLDPRARLEDRFGETMPHR